MLENLYILFELIAFGTAVFYYSKIKQTPYVYFIPYLLFILIYEVGSIQNWFNINHSNLWISNITLIIFFLFYSLFLLRLIKTMTFKGWILKAILVSILFSLINMCFLQGFWNLNTVTILLQFAIIIVISCLYFYELMNYSKIRLVISKLPGFWLNTGLLFFCLAEFLFYSAFAYMAYKNNYEYYILITIIANIANAILYSCLTVSFICLSKIQS